MIKPRGYQIQAVDAARAALSKAKRALLVLATGLGKTITSALTWNGFGKGRGLFLVHNNAILDHAESEYRKVFGNSKKLAKFNGYSKNIAGADIIFATFQTMIKNPKKFPKDYFGWMTVDETHHSHAASFKKVIDRFQCPKLGITATPDRMDRKDIREIFGTETFDVSLEEAIVRGWLPKIDYSVLTDCDFDEFEFTQLIKDIKGARGRLSKKDINKKLFIRKRDENVARIIERRGQKAIVFCQNIEHAENFKKHLSNAATYHSEKSWFENGKVLEDLRNGRIKQVLAVNAFNEGIDVPDVDLIVFYRSTQSETIFRQQLGRGLRPGKKKLTVLDFVGNLQRIIRLKRMLEEMERLDEEVNGPSSEKSEIDVNTKPKLHVTGAGFSFRFSEQLINLVRAFNNTNKNRPTYSTWQEASAAAIRLGIVDGPDYRARYKEDPKLPASPEAKYKDFPGWDIFLNRPKRSMYRTWQEASESAQKHGFRTWAQYKRGYKIDPRLPGKPERRYPDFPGYGTFLTGMRRPSKYNTLQEVQAAARALGIHSKEEYNSRYQEDPRLPSNPQKLPGWPGYKVFLGTGPYGTWQEASSAAIRHGIGSSEQYRIQAKKKDKRLPIDPKNYYEDFPGWNEFFQRKPKQEYYETWEEMLEACNRIGITSRQDMFNRRHLDPKIPCNPEKKYDDFPGWKVLDGSRLNRAKYYRAVTEASHAARRLGIKTTEEYRERRREDSKLPGWPPSFYDDFPGWPIFLGTSA